MKADQLHCSVFFQSHWGNLEGIELHSFVDAASPKGYGAVVYIRKPNPDGTYQISFVTAKTKVALLKKITLPRLELLGSLLAALLHVFCLKGSHSLNGIELETALIEIEGCVNSRPFCFAGDMNNCPNPVTPSHFLIGKRTYHQPGAVQEVNAVTRKDLVERDMLQRESMDKFWSIWVNNYLRNLPPSSSKFKALGNLIIGSVVLIREDNVPRNMQWLLGTVQELYRGRDGLVCSVKLHTTKGTRIRAIQRLHELEISNTKINDAPLPSDISELVSPSQSKFGASIVKAPLKTQYGRTAKTVER